jgi:lysophospholipase L1-like esterase
LKTLAFRLAAVVLLSCALGFGVGELFVRFSSLSPSRTNLRDLHELRLDRPWLFGMRPGADMIGPGGVRYTVNADGFRDLLYARPKPPGTYRILLLGHSVAFGWAVAMEESYPKVLEAKLAETGEEPRIEILNASVCAYNAYSEAALFAEVGASFQPDLVVVEFGINDLNDPTLHFDGQTTLALSSIPDDVFPDPSKRLPDPPPPSLAWRLCEYSELCVFAVGRFAPTLPNAAWVRASAMPREEHSEKEMAWLRKNYERIASDAAKIGARFAVLLLPYINQVEGNAAASVQERVAAMAREEGWPTIDILPGLRAAARPDRSLFLDLWHFTPEGHRIAADAALQELCCRGLLPVAKARCCPGSGTPAGSIAAARTADPSVAGPAGR